MDSNINISQANDLERYEKEEYIDTIKYLNYTPQEVKKLPKKVRELIYGLKKFLKEKDIDLTNEENPGKKILELLNESNDLMEIGIGKKISDILGNNTVDYEKLALFDENTGLPNNVKLKFDIEKNEGNQVVILLKIVGFQELNKTYGYEGGNIILKKIIENIESKFNGKGFELYRESGVTFGLVKKVDNNFDSKELILYLEENIGSMSIFTEDFGTIGIKTKSGLDISEKDQLSNAIMALYKSKTNGAIGLYSDEMRKEIQEKALEKSLWINEVESAINEGRLIPFFQGIRDNRRKKITKYESLVRIKKGDKIISPFFFLKHIEGTHLMKEVTKTMIVKTIEKMKKSENSFSVNLTEKDLNDDEILKLIKDTLSKEGINPSRLTIEVLEESKGNDEDFYSSIKKGKKYE